MAATNSSHPALPLGEVLYAADKGVVNTIRLWLDRGGDANTVCREMVVSGPVGDKVHYYKSETPLMLAAMAGHAGIVRILVQAGADVNTTRLALEDELGEDGGTTESPLTLALANGHPEAAQYLLDHGADRTTFQWMTDDQSTRNLMDHRILRMYFIAGVDISARQCYGESYEERVRGRVQLYTESENVRLVNRYGQVVEVIDGVRLAGSYKQYVLQDYKQLLRIRSLLARGRATMPLETPEVIRRLFGGTTAASRQQPKRPRSCRSALRASPTPFSGRSWSSGGSGIGGGRILSRSTRRLGGARAPLRGREGSIR